MSSTGYERPEWHPAYANVVAASIRAHPLQVPDEEQYHFLLGDLLAHLHASGRSFTDMHPGNVGVLPTGGFCVLDPGGWFTIPLSPESMSGDFVVPALSLEPKQFASFVAGYLFTAVKILDPLYPGYSNRLCCLIAGDDEDYVAPSVPDVSTIVNALNTAMCSAAEIRLKRDEIGAAVIALTISSFDWKYDTPPNLHSAFASILREQCPDRMPVQLHLKDLVQYEDLKDWHCIGSDRVLRPVSDRDGLKVTALPGRPRTELVSALFATLASSQTNDGRTRKQLLAAMGALLQICRMNDISDVGTICTYITLAFGVATSEWSTPEELEHSHVFAWSLFASAAAFSPLSPKAVEIKDVNALFEVCLLFHKAAYFDRLNFERSIRDRDSAVTRPIAWYAGLSSVDANRKALLLLYYTLMNIPEDEPLPPPITSVFLYSLQLKSTNEIRLATFAIERECSSILSILGASSDLIIEGRKWAMNGLETIKAESASAVQILSFMTSGRDYFANVDFELKWGELCQRHSRQDIWHGFAGTFRRDRTSQGVDPED